nr:coronin-1B-like isoform X3 [Penaeus vannamei]
MQTIDLHSDVIYSLSLNRNGSRIATTSRDKRLRVIDPLSGKLLQETICHEGSKACKAVYCGDTGKVFTTGFSRFSDRQFGVWDEKNLNTPLRLDVIDSSSGILTPFYDHDTKIVFVAGKGDGNIRYYEITDSPPYCHFLNQYISGEPQRGLGIMPKRGCKVSHCEIFRFYKLYATKPICEPISMIVPRKSDQFQPDLYPDTASPTPALSAEEWFSGTTKGPVLMSMKTGMTIKTHRPLPLRPTESSSDKNADKKYAFLSMETRADYRPKELSPDNKEQSSTTSSGIESERASTTTRNIINKISTRDSPNKLSQRMEEKEIEILDKPSPKTESESNPNERQEPAADEGDP